MPTTEFSGSDLAALTYVRERGYCSFSSMKNVRDKNEPTISDATWFTFGKELHTRHLEKKQIERLSIVEEERLKGMLESLAKSAIINSLLKGAQNEIDFGPQSVLDKYDSKDGLVIPHLYGVPVYGRIDSLNRKQNAVSDLKSTRLNNMAAFVEEMDFLQAVLYLKVTGCRDFYYWGICKQPPYTVMVFNVNQYPARLAAAQRELRQLLMYIKSKL